MPVRNNKSISKESGDFREEVFAKIRIGIDIGGTFTDFVIYYPETGEMDSFKLLSTPQNPAGAVLDGLENTDGSVTVAMVGKYMDLTEAYKSLSEALIHAGIHTRTKVKIKYLDSEQVETEGT